MWLIHWLRLGFAKPSARAWGKKFLFWHFLLWVLPTFRACQRRASLKSQNVPSQIQTLFKIAMLACILACTMSSFLNNFVVVVVVAKRQLANPISLNLWFSSLSPGKLSDALRSLGKKSRMRQCSTILMHSPQGDMLSSPKSVFTQLNLHHPTNLEQGLHLLPQFNKAEKIPGPSPQSLASTGR